MLKGPPASILFVDVESTGLHSADRIVSLGAIRLSTFEMLTGVLQFDQIHLIFDPGRKSHPKAEEVHGYDDWILRHQQPFSDYAAPLFDFISSAGLVVAHNAEFDKSFLAREFEAAGLQMPLMQSYCTMQAYRGLGLGGSASLSAICSRLAIGQRGQRHDALHDAWLAMQVYLWLHKSVLWQTPFSVIAEPELQNLRDFPPRPEGLLPRRKAKRKAAVGGGWRRDEISFHPRRACPGHLDRLGAGRLTDEQASALAETLEGRKREVRGIDTVAIRAPQASRPPASRAT